MKKRTRSILDELNQVHGNRDNDLFIDTTANNIIESAIISVSNRFRMSKFITNFMQLCLGETNVIYKN